MRRLVFIIIGLIALFTIIRAYADVKGTKSETATHTEINENAEFGYLPKSPQDIL